MAKQMSYTPEGGETSATSYSIPVQINLNRESKTGRITFNIYRDKAARNAILPPIAQKHYTIQNGIDEFMDEANPFDDFFGIQIPIASITDTVEQVLAAQAYLYADAYYDEDVRAGYTFDAVTGIYTKDSDKSTVLVSEARERFFEDALDV